MQRIALADVQALSAALHPAQIDVYFFDSDAAAFEDTLCATERARCARFVTPLLRSRFRACHAGKRAILARYLGREAHDLAFVTGPYDKPRIRDATLGFNLSHSANWVALAIATDEVGVDCERIDDTVDYHGMLETVAHPHERIGDRHAFYRTWTRKEAVMKQLGLGFQLAPARVRVPDAEAPLQDWQGAQIDSNSQTARLGERAPMLLDVSAPPGYCAAVAAETAREIRVFQLCSEHENEGGRA